MMPRNVKYHEERSSGYDAKKCEIPWREKQQLWCQEMWNTMKKEATVMMPRNVKYHEERSNSYDAKKCEIPWRKKQWLWCQKEMWTIITIEATNSSEMPTIIYQWRWQHIPKYLNLHQHCCVVSFHLRTFWTDNYFPRSTDLGISHMCVVTAAPLDHWW